MTPTLVLALVFLTVILGFAGACSFWTDLRPRERAKLREWLNEQGRQRQREQARAALLFRNLSPLGLSASEDEEEPRPALAAVFERMVELSGVPLTARTLLLVSAGLGLAAALGIGLWRHSPLAGAGAGLLAGWLPIAWVRLRCGARLEQMQGQVPDVLDTMARVLRAGHSLTQAFQGIAVEFPPPLGPEFSYCHEQQNLGLSSETALRDLARRTGLLEMKVLVTATIVQQRTGGNLAELLDKIAAVARERLRMRTRIQTMTAEGRLQATLLLGLPPLLFVVLLYLKPDYAGRLLHSPRLLTATVLAQVIGAVWVRAIVRVKW